MKTLLTISFMFMLANVFAQVKISGVVTGEGQTLPGVNVFLSDTYDGATSDDAGKFEFVTSEKGKKIFVGKFIGYKDFTREIEITDRDIQLIINLKEEINELDAVTITAGSFSASDESRRTVFRALDIATTAGATAKRRLSVLKKNAQTNGSTVACTRLTINQINPSSTCWICFHILVEPVCM